ncbi:MAG: pitrilysin family protein [Acutalibacteraceae bacterium]
MNSIEKKTIAQGVSFTTIKEERFKTARISVTMLVPLSEETAPAYSLLPSVLVYSCNKYPTALSLNRALDNLYGASLGGSCRKMGEALAINLVISGLDDRYTMNKEKISSDMINMLCEILFNPKVENGSFNQEDFDQCKRQLLEAIDGEFNDKRSYAVSQMIKNMCKNEIFGIRRYGTREAVENLTPQQLYAVWQQLLVNSKVEVMMIGSSDTSLAESIIKEKFSSINRTQPNIKTEIITAVDKVKEITEESDIAQAKLVMGFRTNAKELYQSHIPMALTVAILGGTPSSKLFLNVREKLSLCYYCAARYDRYKSIMTIDSGVEKENVDKTVAEIKNQIADMQNGEISDFEIDSAKLAVANSYKSSQDTITGIESVYVNQILDDKILTVDEMIQQLNAATKEDIVSLAKTITLDTVYLLKPTEERQD